MRSRILKWAYGLRYHYWGNWSLQGWLIGSALAAAALLVLWHLPAFLAGGSPALWLRPALLVALALALALVARWAAAEAYLRFEPQSGLVPPAGRSLAPVDKLLIHVTGRFEVQGKSHFFAGLLAYWRTFASREHAVMAIVHPSRFLLLGTMPERDLGLWYIFFCPDHLLGLAPGRLTYGAAGGPQPALQIVYQPPRPPSPPPSRPGERTRPRPLPPPETAYLIFDDESTRLQVWADLLADGPGGSPAGKSMAQGL